MSGLNSEDHCTSLQLSLVTVTVAVSTNQPIMTRYFLPANPMHATDLGAFQNQLHRIGIFFHLWFQTK